MGTCIKLTSAVALLIGIEVFSPGSVWASAQPTHFNQLESNNFSVKNSKGIAQKQLILAKDTPPPKKPKFEPKDNKGPATSRGSGTR